jgi:hypothetical protein
MAYCRGPLHTGDSQLNATGEVIGTPLFIEPYGVAGPGGPLFVGQYFSQQLGFGGGEPPYTFAITGGSLPPGLTLNTSTGVISGTPTSDENCNYTATATVTDSEIPPVKASTGVTLEFVCG